MLESARELIARVALLGVSEEDSEEERLRQAATMLVAVIMLGLSPVWVGTYLLIGRLWSAAIPGSYASLSAGMITWIAWRGSNRLFAERRSRAG